MTLEACLPPALQTPAPTITRLAGGLSGAGVYRVEAAGQTFVLKISAADEPLAAWHRRVAIQRQAAAAGLAPGVVHDDASRRAVLTAFVVDRGFPALLMTPATRAAAIAQLGHTLRRVHDLPCPDGAPLDPAAMLAAAWSRLDGFALPAFVGDAVRRVLAVPLPATGRAPVLSHNDVNPGNLRHDGERLVLLDWDVAGANDPLYDLAAVAVFFRFDAATTLALLAAHDGAALTALPTGFVELRSLVAVLCGAMFLGLARAGGHPGTTDAEALALVEVYQRMRAGALDPMTAAGQWAFGLALVAAG